MSDKGKGKATDGIPIVGPGEQNHGASKSETMSKPTAQAHDDEESSSDEEVAGQDEQELEDQDEGDDDNMEEIDTDNIITGGRRTRGKAIDFAKAAEDLPDEDEEDEDEDEDFEDPDAMKE